MNLGLAETLKINYWKRFSQDVDSLWPSGPGSLVYNYVGNGSVGFYEYFTLQLLEWVKETINETQKNLYDIGENLTEAQGFSSNLQDLELNLKVCYVVIDGLDVLTSIQSQSNCKLSFNLICWESSWVISYDCKAHPNWTTSSSPSHLKVCSSRAKSGRETFLDASFYFCVAAFDGRDGKRRTARTL